MPIGRSRSLTRLLFNAIIYKELKIIYCWFVKLSVEICIYAMNPPRAK